MLRHPFAGHRRYSITHRAVQRLRELFPTNSGDDDESLRDRLDEALCTSEDTNQAIHTLDAMLGEPQTLIPVRGFGDLLYAIIKEDTVVTVLPRGHGEEILQRGQAMAQRVAAGQQTDELGERRRFASRDQSSPVVVQRVVRGAARGGGVVSRIESMGAMTPQRDMTATTDVSAAVRGAAATVVPLEKRTRPETAVAQSLSRALEAASRRAAVAALREVLAVQRRESSLLALWNELANTGLPELMTVGDLLDAART